MYVKIQFYPAVLLLLNNPTAQIFSVGLSFDDKTIHAKAFNVVLFKISKSYPVLCVLVVVALLPSSAFA